MHYGHPITRHDPPITVTCSGTCGREIEVEAWEDPKWTRTCASCVGAATGTGVAAPPVKVYDVGAPYTPWSELTNAQRMTQRAHERRTRTFSAPTPTATSLVIGPLVALVGWIALAMCAYVGYRLTHSGEVMSLVGLPLARIGYMPCSVPAAPVKTAPTPINSTGHPAVDTYAVACEIVEENMSHGAQYVGYMNRAQRGESPHVAGYPSMAEEARYPATACAGCGA